MSFVDFMIIGAMKSGTTTLADILAKHPDVCFCRKKEPHFFSKTDDWRHNIDEYRAFYEPTENQLCGEASTTYTCYPEFNKAIWKSLYEFNPRLKLIYIMRHPIDRIVSHYMHNYLRGYTNGTFETDVVSNPTYLNRTRYFVQIRPYLESFGKEQVLLLTFEEFLSDKKAVLCRVSDFLGLDFSKLDGFETVHNNKSIGESKENIRIDQVRENSLIKSIRPLVPNSLKSSVSKTLHRLTERKLEHKPDVSASLSSILWDLLMLDILEIERLIGRELTEWQIPEKSLLKAGLKDSEI